MKFKVYNFSSEWSKIGSITNTDPYSLIFVYTCDGKKFLFKGGLNRISEEIQKLTTPLVVHHTYFNKGQTRSYISTHNFPSKYSIYFRKTSREKILNVYLNNTLLLSKNYKRFPRCFPKELSQFCE